MEGILCLSTLCMQASSAWNADGCCEGQNQEPAVGKILCLSVTCTQVLCWECRWCGENDVLEHNVNTIDLCLECRWCAAGVLLQQTCPLPQMQWPPATSRALRASSQGRAHAPTATWPGLPRCSLAWCMLTAMCWPASRVRGATPWIYCLA